MTSAGWVALGVAAIGVLGTILSTRGVERSKASDIAAQLTASLIHEQREWSSDLRESEEACRLQLAAVREEMDSLRVDLAATRDEVHRLRAQIGWGGKL